MKTEIRLNHDQVYSATLLTKPVAEGQFQFAWVYVVGTSCAAQISITDGATIPTPTQAIPVPGVIGAPLVTNATPPVEITITAGSTGFHGEITIEPTVV